MEKMNCDIIQDLIPSYVDEICSDATKTCVEEHLKDCEACKRIADLCRKTAFSAASLERKQLDGLRKWKSKIKWHNLLSYLFLLFMVGLGLYTFTGSPDFSINIYYILFAVCMIGTCLFTAPLGKLQPMQKADWFMIGGTVLLSFFCLSTMFLSLTMVHHGQSPLGLAPQKVGPFISNILLMSFVVQLLLTVLLLIRLFQRSLNTRYGLCATLTGSFLALAYRTLLNDMSILEIFQRYLLEITLVLLGIGILGALLIRLLSNEHAEPPVS